ncbi:MAG: MucB/RseB C-terminal domain-containing protein [Methylomonas sp.]|jgi:sigma-E factor negative regulatory protein RseB|uniref:MucB/RseB C-terminal domain-containing protein n=1 Tax=Methylomonas sp. TaxID=418 RepID=UPI0025D5A836|nr:MucB/RseB C-terminal domain-containing protein [Methylomonas sp.]MCK9605664.1 MucB/RseB C-terminal domain-containing protein [Methylomonas sp.]
MRFLFVFLFFVSCAFANDDQTLSGQQWLEKVNHAMKSLNYHGTVVFMRHGQVDTMRYQHTFENGIETERLTSLNSPLREVTRQSNEISCLYKESQQKIETQHPIDRSFIVNLPLKPERLHDEYLFAVAGQEMIAMRPAQIIAVLPKDDLRYARKLWIDTASLLPLKVEVYGLDGKTLEQVLFTDLNVDLLNTHTDADQTAVDKSKHHQMVSQAEAFEKSPFELKKWPAGFEKIFFIRNTMQKSRKTVDHLLISDGFSSVSVYFEAKSEKSIEGLRTLGPVNSYSRVIDDLQVTALGEVPVQTVELVAKGVSLR